MPPIAPAPMTAIFIFSFCMSGYREHPSDRGRFVDAAIYRTLHSYVTPDPYIVVPAFAGTTGLRIAHESNRLVSAPMPSMTMLTVLPGFIDPTPTDVPQAMTSPASSVMSCETRLTSFSGAKMMSDKG